MPTFPKERIPFAEAISEKALLKTYFEEMSIPQQVALKAYYGLPLTGRELDIWAIFHHSCTYDELGYVTDVKRIPYIPKEYHEAWPIIGRRAGKTNKFAAPILVYEATMGGHMTHAAQGQDVICYLVAQKLDVAASHFAFLREVLRSSPLLDKMVTNDIATGLTFSNGIQIRPASPSVKAQRGMAIPVVAMDEIGFWYTDSEAANPDVEVVRALAWAQAQFPFYKRFGTTTPWAKEGLAWKFHEAGTEGWKLNPGEDRTEYEDVLVIHATTAAMENPRITRDFMRKLRAKDPESFERESLARFVDSVSGFLSPSLLRDAVDVGIAERATLPRKGHPEDPIPTYIAAIDPAFRKDSFAFTIVHHDDQLGLVQDYVEEFKPLPGIPLDPAVILDSILPILTKFRVMVVYTDQYQFESLYQIALQKNIVLENVDFTGRSKAKIMGSLKQLLDMKRLHLLDPKTSWSAANQFAQLAQLERKLTSGGGVQIAAPAGKHDDLAMVLALACNQAVWQLGILAPVVEKPKTAVQKNIEMIRRKQRAANNYYYD